MIIIALETLAIQRYCFSQYFSYSC